MVWIKRRGQERKGEERGDVKIERNQRERREGRGKDRQREGEVKQRTVIVHTKIQCSVSKQ